VARKKGNQFPKRGNSLHLPHDRDPTGSYEGLIASALRRELGGSHQAVKTLMRWTGASARTSKNWLSGAVGPNGLHLILLMTWSDGVFDVALKLSKRDRSSQQIAEARILIAKVAMLIA
jgi:hypothetical protein